MAPLKSLATRDVWGNLRVCTRVRAQAQPRRVLRGSGASARRACDATLLPTDRNRAARVQHAAAPRSAAHLPPRRRRSDVGRRYERPSRAAWWTWGHLATLRTTTQRTNWYHAQPQRRMFLTVANAYGNDNNSEGGERAALPTTTASHRPSHPIPVRQRLRSLGGGDVTADEPFCCCSSPSGASVDGHSDLLRHVRSCVGTGDCVASLRLHARQSIPWRSVVCVYTLSRVCGPLSSHRSLSWSDAVPLDRRRISYINPRPTRRVTLTRLFCPISPALPSTSPQRPPHTLLQSFQATFPQ